MSLKSTNKQVVEDEVTFWGLYVWAMKDESGSVVYAANENGDVMQIASRRGDQNKIKKISEAARYYGFPPGKAVFLAGRRGITDAEYQEQLQRFDWGLTPDPLDVGVYREHLQDGRTEE